MKTLKYIVIALLIAIFSTGCMDTVKKEYYDAEADRYYYENKNYQEAAQNYKEAAQNGSSYAYYSLYEIYKYGKNGVSPNEEYADRMLKKAVEMKDYRAEYIYAMRFLYSVTPDYQKGIDLLESSAKKEYPYAYLELGYVYLYGLGVPSNRVKAIEYFRLANSFGLKTPNIDNLTLVATNKYSDLDKETIIELQKNLKKLGFYNSTIDGISGPMTRKAISDFQIYYGYEVSGRVSQEILNQTVRELQK